MPLLVLISCLTLFTIAIKINGAKVETAKSSQSENVYSSSTVSSSKDLKGDRISYSSSTYQIIGEKEEITINSWEAFPDQTGNAKVTINFTFKNINEKEVDLQNYAKKFIVLSKNVYPTALPLTFETSTLENKVVLPNEEITGEIFTKISGNPRDNLAINFGVISQDQDKYAKEAAGGIVLNFDSNGKSIK